MVINIREGDTLVITKIDRLARSARDLHNLVYELEEKGISLMVLDQNIDTRTSTGKAFLGMLATFAEFETNIRKERQLEGIAKAKEKGIYKGRKATAQALKPQMLEYVFKHPLKNMVASTGFVQLSSKVDWLSNDLIYTFLTSTWITERLQQIASLAVSSYPSISPNDICN